MMNFLIQIMPNLIDRIDVFGDAIIEILLMVLISGAVSALFGIVFGVILVVTRPGDILENRILNTILGRIIDLFRAVPFIILVMVLSPLTLLISGASIGLKATFFPLIVGTVPFFARQVEQAIAETDRGLVEASESMGLAPLEIIFKVYLRESVPSIIRATTITFISMIGLTAIVGAIGGGGLGAFCYNYGYSQSNFDIMWVSLIVIVILTIIVQLIGDLLVRKTTH